MENKNLFWYHEEFERDVEKRVQHEDEIDFVTEKEKTLVVKGAFNLEHIADFRIVEVGHIEIYLNIAHDQMIPDPSKTK